MLSNNINDFDRYSMLRCRITRIITFVIRHYFHRITIEIIDVIRHYKQSKFEFQFSNNAILYYDLFKMKKQLVRLLSKLSKLFLMSSN